MGRVLLGSWVHMTCPDFFAAVRGAADARADQAPGKAEVHLAGSCGGSRRSKVGGGCGVPLKCHVWLHVRLKNLTAPGLDL